MTNEQTTQSGLTLIELVTTIALVGILLGMAVPSFSYVIQQNAMVSHSNELVSSINLARSEAVKRGVPVKLKAKGATATDEWGAGWIVWIDSNNDDSPDSGEPTLKEVAALEGAITLNSQGNSSLYRFLADGSFASAGASTDTLDVCDTRETGEKGRRLRIELSGHVSISNLTCP